MRYKIRYQIVANSIPESERFLVTGEPEEIGRPVFTYRGKSFEEGAKNVTARIRQFAQDLRNRPPDEIIEI